MAFRSPFSVSYSLVHVVFKFQYGVYILYINIKINVDRGGAETDAAHRGRATRGATGFGLGIVVMGAWEVNIFAMRIVKT